MTWTALDGPFAIASVAGELGAGDLADLRRPPSQIVREAGETTILAREEVVLEIAARHPGSRVERDLAWIRFELPMDWELVGFLAAVSVSLAAAGIPIGAVCGFSRDHVFVPRARLQDALEALARLVSEASRGPRGSSSGPSLEAPRG